MDSIYLEYSRSRMELKVLDEKLAGMLKKGLAQNRTDKHFHRSDKKVIVSVEAGYEDAYAIYRDNEQLAVCGNAQEAAHAIVRIIGDTFLSWADETTAILHASAVKTQTGAIVIMGGSGSGKTSLAVALSEFFPFMGDEYVFFDVSSGTVWCEDFPFQIKHSNVDVLKLIDRSRALPVTGFPHGLSMYFPRNTLSSVALVSNHEPIRLVLFPAFDPSVCGVELSRVPPEDLVPLVLMSLVSTMPKATALAVLLDAISRENVKLVRVRYSNAYEAGCCIGRLVRKEV